MVRLSYLHRYLCAIFGAWIMLGSLSGCDNELLVNAEWEEIAVVYGLINPTDDSNFVRIQRAYLNEGGSALMFSQNPDSIYFDSLDVKLAEYTDGVETAVYNLKRVDGNKIGRKKDEGLFTNEVNWLYLCTNPIKESSFLIDVEYRLVIVNPETGNVVTASTLTLGPGQVNNPINDRFRTLTFRDVNPGNVVIEYVTGTDAVSYNVEFIFRYKEAPANDTSVWEVKEVAWTPVKNRSTGSTRGFVEKSALVQSFAFYEYIANVIPEDPNLVRKPVDMDLHLIGGGEDLSTYVSLSRPSIGIVQKRPEYTNVENGLGLFSCRHIRRYQNLFISDIMKADLRTSPTVAHLNFVE
jgi:hypothetical protein